MNLSNSSIILSQIIPPEFKGKRLDQAVAELFPDYSRSRLQQWIKTGQLKINGMVEKSKSLVKGGEHITINAEPIMEESWTAQNIPLNIVYEDDEILIINKPAGLVVHPAAGNFDNTLVNALLYHAPILATLPRAGIIHRLDKDTTGLLIIAKNLIAHTHLVAALQAREITREYECVVNGYMVSGGTVDAPLGRHPRDRLRQAVITNGKMAVTHYRVLNHFRRHTHLRVMLETGRTHQIRVHMAHIAHPIVGDVTYGGRIVLPPHANTELKNSLHQFKRQALHACKLALMHPIKKEIMYWEISLPADMQALIALLQQDYVEHAAS